MPSQPTVKDQGPTVELDLHGASVYEAHQLIRSVIRMAHERGRKTVRIIHGASTSGGPGNPRTIKNDFIDRLERGEWDHLITGYRKRHGSTTLHLKLGNNMNPETITIADLSY